MGLRSRRRASFRLGWHAADPSAVHDQRLGRHRALWLTLVLMCQDLVAWTQTLLLEGDLQRAEPKRLRSALWHQAGTLAVLGAAPSCVSKPAGPRPQNSPEFQRSHTLPLAAVANADRNPQSTTYHSSVAVDSPSL